MFYDVLRCSMMFYVIPTKCREVISATKIFVRVEFWWPKRGSAVSGCERPIFTVGQNPGALRKCSCLIDWNLNHWTFKTSMDFE